MFDDLKCQSNSQVLTVSSRAGHSPQPPLGTQSTCPLAVREAGPLLAGLQLLVGMERWLSVPLGATVRSGDLMVNEL